MSRLTIDGLKFHYQQSGEGPDVVLVHAFTSNLSVWMLTNIVETLATDFRVTTYDLRGHGASDAPPTGYTSADMAGDFHALHDALGLGPAWLVGHSYGGVIGMHAALVHPEIVRGIIFSDTYFPGLAHVEPNMADANVWTELRDTLRKAEIEIGDRVDFSRLFVAMAALTPVQLDTIRREMGPPGARWLSQLGRLAQTTAGREAFETAGLTAERLAAISQPVVALYDEYSPFNATRDWLAANLPHCTIGVVPGAKHLAPVQNSAAFVSLVQEHLRDLAAAPARST